MSDFAEVGDEEYVLLTGEIERLRKLLEKTLPYLGDCPDIYRPGGDDLANEIELALVTDFKEFNY